MARAEARDLRKEKRGKKREWLKGQKLTDEAKDDASEEERDDVGGESDDEEDWKELKAEERVAKKLKRGKKEEPEVVDSFDGL